MIYKNVCFPCGEKLYGKAKRNLGAITISTGICENCGKTEGIKPAIDWENERKEVLRVGDFD